MIIHRTTLIAFALALVSCGTTNKPDWTGGAGASFRNAEITCENQAERIEDEANRSDFFVGCMGALGWTPKPGTPMARATGKPEI